MTTRTLAVVSAGLGRPSSTRLLADRLAAAAEGALRERGSDVAVEPVDLRDHAHALVDNLLTGFPAAPLRAVVEAVTGADGLIAVTPIFNASYSGLFKTFFDVLDKDALEGRPVLIGATGGTARHSLALDHSVRPMLAYLRANVVPTGVYAASEDWGSGGDGALTERVDRAGAELAGLIEGRAPAGRPDPYADPVPFAEMLAAGRSPS
ncbi:MULTISPECIES: FMN reductase [Thermomonosporaceae]|uniref:FMN reductase n=1 Tax=Thermomonosporaceae TaxID=2012 RepID=UPI00255A9519|nr:MULTISPECIES: FMN reductase [Thermomonosporaceae]MDL4774327.1 FMN reductase [Actinomadura xylanilytica]